MTRMINTSIRREIMTEEPGCTVWASIIMKWASPSSHPPVWPPDFSIWVTAGSAETTHGTDALSK